MHIYSIPDKLEVVWNPEVRAVVDTWTHYGITLEDFKAAVFEKGINFAKAHQGQAWIVDSSQATGVFSQEIQDFIKDEGFKIFAANGIKYFITINSEVSTLTKMTVNRYKSQVGPHGMELVEVASVADAVTWLKEHAA